MSRLKVGAFFPSTDPLFCSGAAAGPGAVAVRRLPERLQRATAVNPSSSVFCPAMVRCGTSVKDGASLAPPKACP